MQMNALLRAILVPAVVAGAVTAAFAAGTPSAEPAAAQELPTEQFCRTDFGGAGSVASWITDNGRTNADECFDYAVSQECGSAAGSVTEQVEPLYPQGPFRLVWNEGDAIDLDAADEFPATFPEDYNGGSVTISYYIVGPESDWFINSELPNFWGGISGTLTIDTDCVDPPTTPTTVPDVTTTTEAPADPADPPATPGTGAAPRATPARPVSGSPSYTG